MNWLFVNVFCPPEHKLVSVPEAGVDRSVALGRITCAAICRRMCPSLVSKLNELVLRDERINLPPQWRCFCPSKIIVDRQALENIGYDCLIEGTAVNQSNLFTGTRNF
jgi:hypothetical protein